MLSKKFFSTFLICFSIIFLYSQENDIFLIYKLCLSALENNSDIKVAEKSYNSAILSEKSANGFFSPSISILSSTTVPNNYEWNKSPDSFTTGIIYTQPIFSGTSIGITGNYSYSITELEKERFILQNPQITFKLTQSLFPFWIQGSIKDPNLLSLKKQTEYLYNQLLYTRQKIIQELIQNYIYAKIEQNNIQMIKNSIELTTKQISAQYELKKLGKTNLSKISELENIKWSYQQDLLSSELNHKSYLKKIMNLTEQNIWDNDLFNKEQLITDLEFEKLISFIRSITNCDYDTYEKALLIKIEIEKTSMIYLKQESAPIFEVSVQPLWNLDQQKVTNWKESWNTSNHPSSWNVGITVNLSPLFNIGFGNDIKKKKLELESAQNVYNSYLKQKQFIKNQYESYITDYEENYKTITKLINDFKIQLNDIKIELEQGQISQIDYETFNVQVKNMILTSDCLQLYIFLYKIMKELLN